jgi:hypothetical protein
LRMIVRALVVEISDILVSLSGVAALVIALRF